ncbi:MAG: rod shape-determining protein MreD [Lachnospiraceae bacterium]|nr:rod shape-determining protein MreD [Lachnospiraceae bacterium]
MPSALIFSFLGWLCVLSESTWLHALKAGGVIPCLSLISVISCGILLKSEKGRLVGLITGLIQDLLFCRVLGFYACIYYLIGHAAGYLSRDMSRDLLILPVLLVPAADLLLGFLQYLIYGFFSGDLAFGSHLLHTILPEMVYSTLITLILYPLWRLLSQFTHFLDEEWSIFISGSRRSRP